ncbi:hypothetical protein [Bacillus sp. SM2101]|uniref:hypothetical protein n=1 Tax=Bacillus sp. SM2101 TaxID=2805366 RepID=UPI001BDE2826|nr:hypothetical protein [Bacillus sp. SM2101]
MGINVKKNNFQLDAFYHQLKTNCSEFGIQREVIDKYIGQVEEINCKNKWNIQEKGKNA